jgi:dienelactone hydrolase
MEPLVRTLSIIVFLLAATVTSAQEKEPAKDQRKALYQFLLKQAQQHFDARRATVAGLKSPDDIRQRQVELKAKFVAALGGFPDKTPLNAKVTGTLNGDGFRVAKVIYESRPDHHVTANLYLPAGQGPFPGVLVPCGHSANGKAADAYQHACILLAKHGFVVLCYDPIGQGERLQLLDANNKPGIKGSTTEHSLIGIGALLVGSSTATYRIWDGMRSLDYLASRPEVDPQRLGCTGNSGGGTLTAYLMALDDRIACAAPSCYITSLERLFATLGPQDAEQNITGQVAFGMEHADYITMRAPRPTLIDTATYDFFDIQGSWTTFREASLIYAKLGHGERVALFEYPDKHGFSQPRREAALRWLRRWLQGKDDAPVEGKQTLFTDEQLQCTRSGQVLEDLKGRSAFQLNAQAALGMAPQRAKFAGRSDAQRGAAIRKLLGLPEEKGAGYKVPLPAAPGLLQITARDGFTLPAWLEGTVSAQHAVIYVSDEDVADKGAHARALSYVDKNRALLRLAPRGLGATAPAPASGKPAHFGSTMKEAFLSLHLDRPLLGQRVDDVLAAMRMFPGDIHLVGVGEAAPVVLHAAALEPRVKQITLETGVVSWANVVNTPLSYQQLASVVPGVLNVYDLSDLAATLAPRPLTIRHPVDAALRPVAQAELDEAYAACRAAYQGLQAAGQLKLQAAR